MNRYLIAIIICLMIVALLLPLTAAAESPAPRSPRDIIEEMTVCYAARGGEAGAALQPLLEELRDADPVLGEKWSRIMALWGNVMSGPKVHAGILPDGLPQTDALCLVVLGFQLNPDGSMKEELIERLRVALKSAEKYPHAMIVCTGGGTAADDPTATEAGRMAEWLIQNGVAPERVLVEDHSLTTAQNAMYTYELLTGSCPQVSQLAIISSDYHIGTGILLFEAEAVLQAQNGDGEKLTVVSNAAYPAPSGSLSPMFQAGALIELSGDTETAFEIYYETYDIHALPTLSE